MHLTRGSSAVRIGVAVAGLSFPALAVLDGTWTLAGAAPSLDGPGEALGFLCLVMGALLVPAVLLGALQGAVFAGLWRLSRRLAGAPLVDDPAGAERAHAWLGWLCAILALAPVGWVCQQIFSGPQAQRVPGHGLISLGLWCLSLLGLAQAVPRLARRLRRGPLCASDPRDAAWLAAALAITVGLYAGDRLVLPRLYPWFHASLAVLLVASAQVGALLCLWRWPRPGRGPAAAPWGWLALGAVVLGGLSLWRLDRQVVLRGLVLEQSTLSGRVVRLQAGLQRLGRQKAAPPPDAPDPLRPPGPGPHLGGRDVFLITVDALRHDCVRPQIMPRTTEIFAPGVWFDRAYTQVPHTSFAVATLLTGKPVYALMTMGQDAAQHETLPTILRRARYKTAAFYPPSVFFIEHERLKGLEDSAYGFEYVKFEYLPAERRTQQVLDFLTAERPERAFVWVHYLEPHEPYDPHPGGPGAGAKDLDRYQGEARFVDREIGRLVDFIRQQRPHALLIFSADHGEEFGEHGGRYHGTTLYEEQVHVPLMMVDLVQPAGLLPRRVAEPVGLIDVAPTILGLLDIAPSARMRGHDVGPWLAAAAPLPGWPVFAEIGRQKMVVSGRDKLICDLSTDACALYDLGRDPAERKNLLGEQPARAQLLQGALRRLLGEANRFEQELSQRLPAGRPDETASLVAGRLGDRSAAAGLARILTRPDAAKGLKRQAAELLGGLCAAAAGAGRPLAEAELRPALEQAEAGALPWVQVGLAALGSARHQVLAAALARDPDAAADLRLAAALALLTEPRPAPPDGPPKLDPVHAWIGALPAAMGLDDPDRVRPLLQALGRSHRPEAGEALAAQLDNVRSRVDVVQALGELSQQQWLDRLAELLRSDPYVPVRVAAAQALGHLSGPTPGAPAPRAVAALVRAQRSEREAPVLAAIADALRQVPPTHR